MIASSTNGFTHYAPATSRARRNLPAAKKRGRDARNLVLVLAGCMGSILSSLHLIAWLTSESTSTMPNMMVVERNSSDVTLTPAWRMLAHGWEDQFLMGQRQRMVKGGAAAASQLPQGKGLRSMLSAAEARAAADLLFAQINEKLASGKNTAAPPPPPPRRSHAGGWWLADDSNALRMPPVASGPSSTVEEFRIREAGTLLRRLERVWAAHPPPQSSQQEGSSSSGGGGETSAEYHCSAAKVWH